MIESKNTMSLLMVLVTFTWALSGIATKYLSFYISENEIVVYRYFFATLSTIPILFWMKIPLKINFKNLLLSLLLALFVIGNTRFYFMGMQHGAAGLGAALVTVLIPIMVYIFMIFSRKSRPGIKDWLALLLGVVGVLFMMNFESFSLSEFSLLTPFFAIALGALFFGETLTIKNALGTIMAVSALVVLNNVKFKDLTNFR